MARPQTKKELLDAAHTQYTKLWSLIDSMSDVERDAPLYYGSDFVKKEAHWDRDKNLRDVLIHLYEWHRLLLGWINSNQQGDRRPFLPEPYTWKSYGDMNVEFWRKHQGTSLNDALQSVECSHGQVVDLMGSFTNEELFHRAHFDWTGTATLGSYGVSATSSHCEWAMKKIRASRRASNRMQ